MRKSVKEKWVKALKSGEYKQSKLKLRSTAGFCCLGVLYDLYSKYTGNGEWRYDSTFQDYTFFEEGDVNKILLSESVMKWSGIKTKDGNFMDKEKKEFCALSRLNDGGMSFTRIADVIEEYF